MKIAAIKIKNFRRLKNVVIELSEDNTLFVGANNSGKTSAMDALRKFLVKGSNKGSNFVYNDLPATNRAIINKIGEEWLTTDNKPASELDWYKILPSMDVWLSVEKSEFHFVSHIIPTLSWAGGLLGVRLSFLPKDIEKLFLSYVQAHTNARDTEKKGKKRSVKLHPNCLCDFIEKEFSNLFAIKAFILDDTKIIINPNEPATKHIVDFGLEQDTEAGFECTTSNPLDGIIKVDMIQAQRGLADADTTTETVGLSPQLRSYYDKHLDVEKETSVDDLDTLDALKKANEAFDVTLETKFKPAFEELENLGFPSISDPKITIKSKLREMSAFEHDSAVQYALTDDDPTLSLPERYNGLGYQNLVSIAFRLMSFRDERLQKGKVKISNEDGKIAPLHLVLLEEPEAHLHVQVQQVLIKRAYEILSGYGSLAENGLDTQLLVSTHSSHISKELSFDKIRYFKRKQAAEVNGLYGIEVVNLTNVFGSGAKKDENTERFVQRYIKVTHCDLFFADAVIFVEGSAESILVPYFIKNEYPKLDSRYITILPIGGSHTHRFKPLTDKLEIPVLVVTDIDPVDTKNNNRATCPVRNNNIKTNNVALDSWGVSNKKIAELFDLEDNKKELANGKVRVAYQTPVNIKVAKLAGEVLAATFEDALVYANIETINSAANNTGVFAKVKSAVAKATIGEFNEEVYKIFRGNADKASFALDLLYELEKIDTPSYIKDGLSWLQKKLQKVEAVSLGSKANAKKDSK